MKNITYRHAISLFFLLLGSLVLLAGRQLYRRAVTPVFYQQSGQLSAEEEPDAPRLIKELRTLLVKNPLASDMYQVVAEKNLFAANREAWAPPTAFAADGDDGEEREADDGDGEGRRDVILYGTMIANDTKKALLEFKRFRRDKPKRLVSEGETVASELGQRKYLYTLVEVKQTSVVVKEGLGGETFTIPLFDEYKKRPAATVTQTTPTMPTITQTAPPQAVMPMPADAPAPAQVRPAIRRLPSVRRLPQRLPNPDAEDDTEADNNPGNVSSSNGVNKTLSPAVNVRRYRPVLPGN
ncbi:MAG: hypothetical protein JXO49_03335 [Deltaproteobacteria bacterium]|nr:hypothetical protein [Candidatus Anaeroferrophillus wilburensis]MBN2888362.1 hypothetical protein [Deltaproteobacteria bacterium]